MRQLKSSRVFKIASRALLSLVQGVLLIGLDNRVLAPLLGIRPYGNASPAPCLEEPKLRFGGRVRDYGRVLRCTDVLLDFDLYEKDETTDRSKRRRCEEGFMRIGNAVSPSDVPGSKRLPLFWLDNWLQRTPEPPPAVTLHDEPTLLSDLYHKANPAMIFRTLYYYLRDLDALGVDSGASPGGVTLLLLTENQAKEELDALPGKLFNVCNAQDMRGVHLFRDAIYPSRGIPAGRQHPSGVNLLRSRLLDAFGITPRERSTGVNRITLILRRDYKVSWGYHSVSRKISNEDEVLAALHREFPAADVRAVRMEEMAVEEQLRLIHGTDVLIAMHGAALGFAALLARNAGVLELFPCHFLLPHYFTEFYPMVIGAGAHYRRWINFNPRREYASDEWVKRLIKRSGPGGVGGVWNAPKRDFTEVPPEAVLRRVRALRRCILRGK